MMSRIIFRKDSSPPISGRRTALEGDRLKCLGQDPDGTVTVFGGQQVELGFTIVAPVRNPDGVVVLQVVKRGPEERFLSRKFCGSSNDSAFVADHYEPKSDGPRVVPRPSVKCGNPDFVPVV